MRSTSSSCAKAVEPLRHGDGGLRTTNAFKDCRSVPSRPRGRTVTPNFVTPFTVQRRRQASEWTGIVQHLGEYNIRQEPLDKNDEISNNFFRGPDEPAVLARSPESRSMSVATLGLAARDISSVHTACEIKRDEKVDFRKILVLNEKSLRAWKEIHPDPFSGI